MSAFDPLQTFRGSRTCVVGTEAYQTITDFCLQGRALFRLYLPVRVVTGTPSLFRDTIYENIEWHSSDWDRSELVDDYHIGFIAPGIRYSKFSAFDRVIVNSTGEHSLRIEFYFGRRILFSLAICIIFSMVLRIWNADGWFILTPLFPLILFLFDLAVCYARVVFWTSYIARR